MAQRASCPICNKRRPERFCPAQGEKICAICCGTERERTLDCPADCPYLVTAHRYEREHRQPIAEADIPFAGVEVSRSVIYEQQTFLSGMAHTIVKFAGENRELADLDALAAASALAETYRTLISGIYYEKPPDAFLPAALYSALAAFVQQYKEQAAGAGLAGLKDSAIFQVLVYLARICRGSTNGRPRSRMFLQMLRSESPQAQEQPAEPPRIIVP